MPATTPKGYPYVLPTDHPLEYPSLSQQLAAAIDALHLQVEANTRDTPGARRQMYRSAPVSVPNGAWFPLAGAWWATEGGDTGNGLITYSGGIMTVTAAAVLDISAYLKWTTGANGYRHTCLMINGVNQWTTTVAATATANAHSQNLTVTGLYCAAGTTLQLSVHQTSGAALNVDVGNWHLRRVALS